MRFDVREGYGAVRALRGHVKWGYLCGCDVGAIGVLCLWVDSFLSAVSLLGSGVFSYFYSYRDAVMLWYSDAVDDRILMRCLGKVSVSAMGMQR